MAMETDTASSTPWTREEGEIVHALGTDPGVGLQGAEASRRFEEHGANELRPPEPIRWWKIIVRQFKSLVVMLLVGAAVVSAVFGEIIDAVAIAVVVLVNAAIGAWMEYGATRSMESLRSLGRAFATVIRDGERRRIDAREVVPGDVVGVEAGDVVPADLRILEQTRLQVDESVLTGESFPVSKLVRELPAPTLLADRSNMLFRGTSVTSGEGRGVVVATGMHSEVGRIAELAAGVDAGTTPLERRLDELGRRLVGVAVVLSGAIGVAALLAGRSLHVVLETGIALAVATVPEGLPIVATIALANGMWRLARRNAVVKDLAAVETLGATTVICVDKTGTVTLNRLRVESLIAAAGRSEDEALQIATLCNGAALGGDRASLGDPLEVALLERAAEAQIRRPDLVAEMPEIRREPFDATTRMMATFHQGENGILVAVKGAPEAVLPACPSVDVDAWSARAEKMAHDGRKVIALARKVAPNVENPYENLEFVGLVGLADPPRQDAEAAVRACREAGIRVVMITGDHPETAAAISRQVGIGNRDGSVDVVTGADLDTARIEDVDVFARVEPAQKLDIVRRMQDAGHIVAMTGDGVNDAPALMAADIGVAMGNRGTDVAREAADIVLRDDALGSIVAAVRRGRAIFDNIRKFVFYLLSCNASELLVVAVSFIALPHQPMPITALQILFLNLVTDVFPALALGVSSPSVDAMTRRPRKPGLPFLERRDWLEIAGWGTLMMATTMGAFHFVLTTTGSTEKAVTVAFLALAFGQLFHVFNTAAPAPMRGHVAAILNTEVSRNPWVWAALALCTALLIVPIYIPPFADALSLTAIGGREIVVLACAALAPALLGALLRFLGYRPPESASSSPPPTRAG